MDLEYLTFNAGGEKNWRIADLHGRKHIVVKCVTITEGVHNGSKGKVYYSKDFLKKRPASWDNKPAVVYHPENKSACDASVLNTRAVGVQLTTAYGERKGLGRWAAEAWLDYDRTRAVDARIIKKVENNEKVEVSTGLYIELKEEKGTWNGEAYDYVAVDYSPDHLAILPDKIGACSIAKGAGLLANAVAATKEPESLQFALGRMIDRLVKDAAGHGLVMVENELSFTQISRQLTELLSARFGEKGQYWRGYVQEVYPDYVVYCSDGGGEMYTIGYTAPGDGVKLSAKDPVAVTRVVSYEPVSNSSPETEESSVDKKTLIDNLIKNGVYAETDRTELEKVDEKVLAKVPLPKKEEPAPVGNQKKEEPAAAAVPAPKPKTRDEWMAEAPPEMVETWNEMAAATNAQRAELVKNILAVKDCPFTADELNANTMKMADLKKIAVLAGAGKKAAEPAAGTIPLIGNTDFRLSGGTPPAPAVNEKGKETEVYVPKPHKAPVLSAAKK